MSSNFGDNFHREESEQLDFDDTAFYYFALAMLSSILLPATYLLVIKPMTVGEMIINTSIKNCQCQTCKARMVKRQAIYRFAFLNKWLVLRIIVIAYFWGLTFQCYNVVKDIEEIKGFVPHEILGVQPSASVQEVKRAYRKLSREKHPDKNPDNPAAVSEFIQITKAYTVSTLPLLPPLDHDRPRSKGEFPAIRQPRRIWPFPGERGLAQNSPRKRPTTSGSCAIFRDRGTRDPRVLLLPAVAGSE